MSILKQNKLECSLGFHTNTLGDHRLYINVEVEMAICEWL